MSYRRPTLKGHSAGALIVWIGAATIVFALSLIFLWPSTTETVAPAIGAGLAYIVSLALLRWLARERRQRAASEAQSQLAERRLVDFTGVSSDWLWEMDRDLRFTWFSPRMHELSGVAPETLLGRTRQEIARDPASEPALMRHLEDLRGRRPFRNFVYSRRDPDGQPRYFEVNGDPIYDAAGVFTGYRGTGRDVTAVKRAEERLLDAIDAMNDGFILWDADDRVVMLNRGFLRMDEESFAALKPGTRFEEIMRARVYAGKVPAAIGREEEYIRERLTQHRNPTGEPIVQRLATGQWVRIVERRTRDGGVVAIRSDITGLQRQQTEILHAKEQAEEASRAKTRFLATMSHELRTPLNAIIGFSEVMQTGAFGPLGSPKYAEYAAAINASGRHLLNLIGDILDMSRIEAGRYTLHPAAIEIGEIVRESFLIVRGQAEERGIVLTADVGRGLARVHADRLAVKQILINLLSNAIKFTARGGQVAVAARHHSKGGIEITVRDTGIGIARERLPRLFEPFSTTADAALARETGGTGLGLSICKRLIELHGGEIAIASEPGRGTTVTVSFPPERTMEHPT